MVRGAASAEELKQANQLMSQSHLPVTWDALAWLESAGAGMPGFRLEHTRMAWLDGQLAGALRLLTAQIRIGLARWKVGGIGWVSTRPDCRNRGVCCALMEDTHAYMRARDYHASLLFGVPNLYHRFGYTVALADHTIRLETVKVRLEKLPKAQFRPLGRGDIAALKRIHDAQENEASCSLVRTNADWKNQFLPAPPVTPLGPDWRNALGMADERGRLCAYAMFQPAGNQLHIKEAGVRAAGQAPALLRLCVEFARRKGFGTLVFHVPPWHPLARLLEQFDSLHVTEHFENREGMLRLINIESALEAMRPEWKERLPRQLDGKEDLSLMLGVDNVIYDLHGEQSNSRTAPLPLLKLNSQELVRLLVGFDYAEDVLQERLFRCSPSLKTRLRALFPKRHPYVWPIDHF